MSHLNKPKSKNLNECMTKLKMLYGLAPYNNAGNQVYKDGWFARSIESDFEADTIKQAKKELKIK